jgi:Actin like proteins N terminal domain
MMEPKPCRLFLKSMNELLVAIDVGGSSTKVVYQSWEMKRPDHWLMDPYVEPISQHQLNRFMEQQAGLGKPRADRQAWLVIDEQIWVVGPMAQHFMPENRLHEKKYENALYKVLATIGIILEDDNLPTDKAISLRLAMVLPMDEFGDRKRLHEQLQIMLKSFSFRGKRYRVKLEKFICRPEGAGLMAFFLQKFPRIFADQNVGFIMLGHRNVTGLRFEAGELKVSDSPLLGFAAVLNQVVAATSGIQPQPLCEALFEAQQQAASKIYQPFKTLHPNWATLPSIQALITVKQPALRQAEIAELGQAITIAIQDYWERIERWLHKLSPGDLKRVVIGGGAAPFLQPQLEQFFNCPPQRMKPNTEYTWIERAPFERDRLSTNIHWWTSLPSCAHDSPHIDEILNQFGQDGRLIDVRGLFTLLQEEG